jgi:hypothetical protein
MAFYWTAKGNFYAKLWTSPAPPVNGTTDSRGSVTTVCLSAGLILQTRTMCARMGDEKMSYDISLCDPVTHKPLKADSTHFIAGGMRAMGGTKELWLNVTYNYSQFYYRPEVFGEGGIRSIYGKTGAESIPMLEKAISALGDDVDDSDYWNATEGNAKRALYGLLAFAKMRPDGVWEGD